MTDVFGTKSERIITPVVLSELLELHWSNDAIWIGSAPTLKRDTFALKWENKESCVLDISDNVVVTCDFALAGDVEVVVEAVDMVHTSVWVVLVPKCFWDFEPS